MDRLTERFSNGQAAVYGCGSNCKYDFKYCNKHLEDCPTINEIYERLAQYEEIGTVEDFKKALKNARTLSSMYEKLRDQEVAEFHKLAEYEDIGLTPEQLLQVDEMYTDRCREIAGLERKIGKTTNF